MGISHAIRTSPLLAAGRSLLRLSCRSGLWAVAFAFQYLSLCVTLLIFALIIGLRILAAAPVLLRPPDLRPQP